MPFLKKLIKKHGPEPERMVTVHVGDGEPRFHRVFVLPASHLTRPRLAPLVAMAEDDHQGQGDVIRIRCDLGDFVDAMIWTAVEEAEQGRLSCGRVLPPPVAPVRYKLRSTFDLEPLTEDHIRARQAMLIWMLDPGSCDPAIFDLALTGDLDDVEAAADVFTSQTPEQLATLRQNCKKTSSSAQQKGVATRRTKKSKSKTKLAPAVPTNSLTVTVDDEDKHPAHPGEEALSARHIKAQQALLRSMLDPAGSCDASILDELVYSRSPAQLQILRENSSAAEDVATSAPAVPTKILAVKIWCKKMSERLRIVPSPKAPPPPPPFRPTWVRNRRTSVSAGISD